MNEQIPMTGTLADGDQILLDQTVPLSGNVRIRVEPLDSAVATYLDGIRSIWAAQKARGFVPRSARQVNEEFQAERASWGDSR